jgi:hypothetical protein
MRLLAIKNKSTFVYHYLLKYMVSPTKQSSAFAKHFNSPQEKARIDAS